MKKLLIFCYVISNINSKEIKIFSIKNLFKLEEKVKDKLINNIDKINKEETHKLCILSENNEVKENFDILNKFDILILNTENKLEEKITCCNIFKENDLFPKYLPYKNFYINNLKISVIGLSINLSKDEIFKDPLEELKKYILLLEKSYNPDILIVVSNIDSKEIIEFIKNKKNILLISDYSFQRNILKQEIGDILKINLEIENKELIDCKVEKVS